MGIWAMFVLMMTGEISGSGLVELAIGENFNFVRFFENGVRMSAAAEGVRSQTGRFLIV